MIRNHKIVNIVLFMSFLVGCLLLNIFHPTQAFSPNENRNLAQLPKFTLDKLFKDKYTVEFENFITDQFIFRDQWVEGKTIMERLLGKLENNGVYFGKDDTLIERIPSVNVDQVNKNVKVLNQFINQLSKDVQVDMMLIPGASSILLDKLPWMSDDVDQLAYINQIEKAMSSRVNFINVNQEFLDHASDEIYFRTDHHFNLAGSKIAYEAYMNALGIKPHEVQSTLVKEGFLGTLGSSSGAYYTKKDDIYKVMNDENITVYYPDTKLSDNNVYLEDNLTVKDKYTYYLNGNHSQVNIKTNQVGKEKLLILRDSYANIFTPYLVEDFEEITLLDLRYYKSSISDYIKEYDIDRVFIFYSGKNFMNDVNFTFLK